MCEYVFTDCNSIWLCEPQSPEALAHLRENTDPAAVWHGPALVVEPRFLGDFVANLEANGHTCSIKE